MSLFKAERKELFIKSKGESYKSTCYNIFHKSYEVEVKYSKDLYEFNLDEIKELMKKLESKSVQTSRSRLVIITQYINFFLYLRIDKKNPLHKVNTRWGDRFVISNRKIISENELEEIIEKVPNAQDKVVYQLIFEGVQGPGFSELLNLKVDDIKWETNTLKLHDNKKNTREIKVTDRCMSLLKAAIKEQKYIRRTGRTIVEMDFDASDLEFIIKRNRRNKNSNRSYQIIYSRFKHLKSALGNQDITPNILRYSGIARKGIDLSRKENIPLKELSFGSKWNDIALQFNEPPGINKGQKGIEYTYYHNFRNNIDLELVHELYGEFEDYKIDNFELVDENDVEYRKVKIKKRMDPHQFRELVLSAYNNRCAITGEILTEVLEACHIQPYVNDYSNHIQNGILLRIDFHRLFDSGFITIDENYTVKVSPYLESEYYQKFNGMKIKLPTDPTFYPSMDSIRYHNTKFRGEVNEQPEIMEDDNLIILN